MVESAGLDRDLTRVLTFLDTRPIYETPLATGTAVPKGLGSLSAGSCGGCHAKIYAEWKVSTHAAAWRDRQYQAEIGKSGNRWLCLNCHTPLLVQHDLWPIGLVDGDVERPRLVPNPVFDEALRDEGITCAACHVRDGVVHGPGLGGSAPHPVRQDFVSIGTALPAVPSGDRHLPRQVLRLHVRNGRGVASRALR